MTPSSDPSVAPVAGERPYFLWWTDANTADFVRHLEDPDLDRRAYWLGALLREAHTRDVWAFTSPAAVRALWPRVARHLGRSHAMWAWLLQMDAPAARRHSWRASTGV